MTNLPLDNPALASPILKLMRGGRLSYELSGLSFGRWTVDSLAQVNPGNGTYWHCTCECGTSRVVRGCDLVQGESSSCGCLKREQMSSRATKHGQSRTLRANLFYQTKYRAKKNGLPFDLKLETFPEIPDVCPILGLVLKNDKGKLAPNSPSVDRIIPSLGYVEGNIQIISLRANTIKSNATAEELQKVADFVKAQLQGDKDVQ